MFRQLAPSARIVSRLVKPLPRSPTVSNERIQPFSTAIGSIFSTFHNRRKIQQLKEVLEKNPNDEQAMMEYVRTLNAVDAGEAAKFIETGWLNGKLPINEELMKEYLKSASVLKKLDTLNVSALLGMIQRQEGAAATTKANGSSVSTRGMSSSPDIASILRQSSLPSSQFSHRGSVNDPVVVTFAEAGWKSQFWKLVRHGVTLFVAIAFLGTFLDDKSAAGSFGKSLGLGGSAVHQIEKSEKTFEDVVGIDEAKSDLQEIVMYLKDPKKFTRLGGRLPKGVLLTGPPGTGKTLLARAIAGEAKVPFFHASGSEFEEMYVGVGAKRVRELFDAAKAKSPCIIFIDEIDAIGGSRQLKDQSAMKMTLNQLLVEMDGFQQNNGIIVIAATNFPDSLDSALIRPGRFDKHVDVPMPDIGGRKAILELYATKVPLDGDVDLEQIARGTPGFSGAELFNLINQAALKASVDGLKAVTMHALEYAKDKIMMGAERKSAIISPETIKMTAFHEAGHALVALKTKGADPIHKATIMPRGRALGMVMQLPDGDQTSMSRQQMLARLDVCMGGRVAEEVIFGEDNVTSGATSDIQQATRLATAMVTKYGLSSKVGVIFIDEKQKLSGSAQDEIDKEIKTLLSDSYSRAKKCIEQNASELTLLANGLMEYESLSGSEVVDIISNRKISQVKRSQKPSRTLQTIPGKPKTPATAPIPPVIEEPAQPEPLASTMISNEKITLSQKPSNNASVEVVKSNNSSVSGLTSAPGSVDLGNSASAPSASSSSSSSPQVKSASPQRGPPKI